jgi:hypothetical protein
MAKNTLVKYLNDCLEILKNLNVPGKEKEITN